MLLGNVFYYLLEFFVLSPSDWGHSGWWGACIAVFGFMMLLGVMPNDVKIIRFLSLVAALSLIQVGFIALGLGLFGLLTKPYPDGAEKNVCETRDSGCVMFVTKFGVLASVYALGGGMCATLLKRKPNAKGFAEDQFVTPARTVLEKLWLYARVSIGLAGAAIVISSAAMVNNMSALDSYYSEEQFESDVFMGCMWMMTSVLYRSAVRRQLHAFLGSINTSGETKSAASIAALIGGLDPATSLARAQSRFRTISFKHLRREDLLANSQRDEENQENELYSMTEKTMLGGCDGFISHSWSDDGGLKYEALKKWASDFEEKRGRAPQIWLDKACIDQTNIDDNLQVLPIFLAGCEKLIIVAGTTYKSRLWCIMEVFTFLKMGGSPERVVVIPVGLGKDEAKASFDQIDVCLCKCYNENDKQKLFAIIEQGFGTFLEFNLIVRSVFSQRLVSVKR
ncbi:hypothetical protein TrRE_jg67, partial [Triparma retinervis]